MTLIQMGSSKGLLLLGLITAAAAFFWGCDDKGPDQEPVQLSPEAIHLQRVSFGEVFTTAFPAVELEEGAGGLFKIRNAPEWQIEPLPPRLIGRFRGEAVYEAAISFILRGPSPGRAVGLDLVTGVYVFFASLETNGGLKVREVSLLAADGSAIMPVGAALVRGVAPFLQAGQEGGALVTVAPAFSTDGDDDGQDELVLAFRFSRGSLSWVRYVFYRFSPGTASWQRIGDEESSSAQVPAQAVLNYWANVSAAVVIGARWEPVTRLTVVWRWLTDPEGEVTPLLVRELAAAGDLRATREIEEALVALRSFFQQAYTNLSKDFRVAQPWPGFVNAFRNTEKIEVEGVMVSSFRDSDMAEVDTVVRESRREGVEVVQRRLRTTFEVSLDKGTWLLDGVEAKELRQIE